MKSEELDFLKSELIRLKIELNNEKYNHAETRRELEALKNGTKQREIK